MTSALEETLGVGPRGGQTRPKRQRVRLSTTTLTSRGHLSALAASAPPPPPPVALRIRLMRSMPRARSRHSHSAHFTRSKPPSRAEPSLCCLCWAVLPQADRGRPAAGRRAAFPLVSVRHDDARAIAPPLVPPRFASRAADRHLRSGNAAIGCCLCGASE